MPGTFIYPLPHPAGAGYGGVGWSPRAGMGTYDSQNVAAGYGGDPYGSIDFPAPPLNVTGGYGGGPYGIGPYGSIEHEPPRLSSAVSLNGWEIEVFFSEEMDPNDPNLIDPDSYTLTPTNAAPSEVTDVRVEKLGSLSYYDTFKGVLSVVLTHTGTTMGGTYTLTSEGPTDVSGNPLLSTAGVILLTMGEAPTFTVTVLGGNELLFQFSHAMLPPVEEIDPSTGITAASSYNFASCPDYPIVITPTTITFPYDGDDTQVHQQVVGMTTLDYAVDVSPASDIEYDGTILPNEATQYDGVEINPGDGNSAIQGGSLFLNKEKLLTYGWDFLSQDPVQTGTTFRADMSFNAGVALYQPPLVSYMNINIAQIVVADGPPGVGTQVIITLQRITGGADRIHFMTDTWSSTAMADWSSGDVTLSVVRNRKAQFVTFLMNDRPLTTIPEAAFNGTPLLTGAGIRFTLYPSLTNITGFKVLGVKFSHTQTVWSAAWNFMHGVVGIFSGSGALTRPWLLTQRGPLVKNWGDMTPATKQDVTLWVNGSLVDVDDVNPFWGKVTPTIPIPLLPPGDPQADVKVDYHWMATPILPIEGLNIEGATLNKWDRATGHHDPASHGEQIQDGTHPKGAADISRFPMGVVLGPPEYPEPLWVSHRYQGFEKEYSALLNSPSTMILNQNPKVSQIPAFESPTDGITRTYDGILPPTSETPPWTLVGTDTGAVDDGVYTVIDSQSGPYNPEDPKVAMYWEEVDFSFPSSLYVVGRFSIPIDNNDGPMTSPHGIFTGVGFGVHDNHHLYLVGALELPSSFGDSMKHVGLLLDPTMMHLLEGWEIGPKATVTITASSVCIIPSASVPTGFAENWRFNILDGSQAGEYTAQAVVAHSDGTTEVTVTPAFPADYRRFGNKYPDVIFEVDWTDRAQEEAATYRLVIDPEIKSATLDVAGHISGQVAELDGQTVYMPQPAKTGLLLSTEYKGQAFWGSLDSYATSNSAWSFYRYGVVPDQTSLRGYVQVVNTEMSHLPEEDPNNEWFLTEPFGYSRILPTGGMLFKSTAGSDVYRLIYGYKRIEPFLFPESNLDLRAQLEVDSAVLGAGDAEIVVRDNESIVRLATLMYWEGGDPWRQLVRMPAVSAAGFTDVLDQGWTYNGDPNEKGASVEADFVQNVSTGVESRYVGTVDTSGMVCGDSGERIGDVRVSSDTEGYLFTMSSSAGYTIQVSLTDGGTPTVELWDETPALVQSYSFDWNDGVLHDYRLILSGGVVSLLLDNELQTPTVNATSFATGGSDTFVFGTTGAATTRTLKWRSVSHSVLPPSSVKRTFGIWLGGDKDDIDQWEIPRTDSSSAANSEEIGPVVEEMDWRDPLEVRLLKTPEWGVTMLRPDLPMPPYYVPETPGVPGSGYATQTAVPSAGWINVEEARIPQEASVFGSISFGALDQRSITLQRWEWVRYKIFKSNTDEHKSPEHMVLNQSNVITSGELLLDRTLEQASIQVMSATELSLAPTHMYAEDVYKVIDGEDIYTRVEWNFDSDQQKLILKEGYSFSAPTATVSVMFYPGRPVTNTYLEGQPVRDGMTLLNEGTPPIPKSQDDPVCHVEVHGSFLNDPHHILNEDPDFTLNDPYNVLTFEDDADTLYQNMSFMEIPNDGGSGLISSICEGTLPQGFSGYEENTGEKVYSKSGTGESLNGVGQSAGLKATGDKVGETTGAHVLGLKGTKFWEKAPTPQPDDFEQGGGMPGKTLFASGGHYLGPIVSSAGEIIGKKTLGGTLGPGTAILYPNFPSGGIQPGRGEGKIHRRTEWFLRLHSIITDASGGSVGSVGGTTETDLTEDLSTTTSDNTPPTAPYNWLINPSGLPPLNGYGAALMEYNGSGEYSHTGPWGGQSALAATPDTGLFEFAGATVPNGTTATVRDASSVVSVTFIAVAAPVLPTEFAAAPTPHLSLADAINNHAVTRGWVRAEAGLTWWGSRAVTVEALMPVVAGNLIQIQGDCPNISVRDVLGDTVQGTLTGGAKIRQSSLLPGDHSFVTPLGLYDSLNGFGIQGGAALPQGGTVITVLESPAP